MHNGQIFCFPQSFYIYYTSNFFLSQIGGLLKGVPAPRICTSTLLTEERDIVRRQPEPSQQPHGEPCIGVFRSPVVANYPACLHLYIQHSKCCFLNLSIYIIHQNFFCVKFPSSLLCFVFLSVKGGSPKGLRVCTHFFCVNLHS